MVRSRTTRHTSTNRLCSSWRTRTRKAENSQATLVLLSADGGISGGGGTYVLPVATKDRLGGVKLGDGFSTTPDGTLSYEGSGLPDEAIVTTGDTEQMLDEVFPPEEDEPQN